MSTGITLAFFCVSAHGQQQLTSADTGDSTTASIANDGSRVAFQSTADLADGSSNDDGNNEIFVVDADGSDPVQLTDSATASTQPRLAGNGARVVFVSSADLTDNNADGNTEVFLVEVSGAITQITDTTGANGIQGPSISSDGTRIAYTATADLLGDGSNSDGSREVFSIDSDGGDAQQLTDGTAGTTSQFATLSPDGAQVVYSSNANPTGGNADGSTEIFTVSSDGNGTATQLTDAATGASQRPAIASTGDIAFESTADLDGNNADGNSEIFVVNADGSGLVQLTATTMGTSNFASIANDGSRIAFQSSADLDDQNGDNSVEVFIIDGTDSSSVRQVTGSMAASSQPVLSADGSRLAFQSTADLSGNNANGNSQIFVIDPVNEAVGNGGGSDTRNFDEDDGLFCGFVPPGCSLCESDEADTSTTSGESDEDSSTVSRRIDPTLALLAMFAGIAVVRRRRR